MRDGTPPFGSVSEPSIYNVLYYTTYCTVRFGHRVAAGRSDPGSFTGLANRAVDDARRSRFEVRGSRFEVACVSSREPLGPLGAWKLRLHPQRRPPANPRFPIRDLPAWLGWLCELGAALVDSGIMSLHHLSILYGGQSICDRQKASFHSLTRHSPRNPRAQGIALARSSICQKWTPNLPMNPQLNQPSVLINRVKIGCSTIITSD
jgi:hypothetical protein